MFFKELDFPLLEIKKIISSKDYDMRATLIEQKHLVELKRKRLDKILTTLEKTINNINNPEIMKDEELYDSFSKEEMDQYAKEAKERWWNTKVYKESQERYKRYSAHELAKIKKDWEDLMEKIALNMHKWANSKAIQDLISLLKLREFLWAEYCNI
jgi:DNA-binding transcriptional MerR regulator